MAKELEGIHEKIKRADENIRNLNLEIIRFFDESLYPVIANEDGEFIEEAIKFHLQRPLPLRFSVLAGETVHHLRSCFDHLIWQLSSNSYRTSSPNSIEFPVFDSRPSDKSEIARYERKVKGINDPQVLTAIQCLQPYNAAEPFDDPLFVIHDMDRFDKHRELAIVFMGIHRQYSTEATKAIMDYQKAKSPELFSIAQDAIKKYSRSTMDVAFLQKGQGEGKAVVPYLTVLLASSELLWKISRDSFDSVLILPISFPPLI